MCDYSAEDAKSRAAVKGDSLISKSISAHTMGFVGIMDRLATMNDLTAVCMLPGTELMFDKPVRVVDTHEDECTLDGQTVLVGESPGDQTAATFVQVDVDEKNCFHDALRFADNTIVYVAAIREGQTATVVTLPAEQTDDHNHHNAPVAQVAEIA